MDAETIVKVVEAVVLFAVFVGGVFSIKGRLRAERRYLELLCAEHCANDLRKLREEIMRDGVASHDEMRQLIAALDHVTLGLSKKDRALVRQGLIQQSILGRARYAAKLLNKAGIGSGPIPVPMW